LEISEAHGKEMTSRIDCILSELLADIKMIEQEREEEIKKVGKIPDSTKSTWSEQEISYLIRGVFKNGENEWTELNEDLEAYLEC
jgi:hypothetical protein